MPENAQSVLASFGFTNVGHRKSARVRWPKPNPTEIFDPQEVFQYAPIEAAEDVIRKEIRSAIGTYLEPSARCYFTGSTVAQVIGWPPSPVSEELEKAIEQSKSILELQVDPDSGVDVAYASQTLNRATTVLRGVAESFWNDTGSYLPVPSISPAPGGSIDVFWEAATLTLLINIPAGAEKSSTFYGRNKSGSKISGSLAPGETEVRHLTGWLMGREQGAL
jgi:hypothetical protein